MTPDAWLTLGVIAALFGTLVFTALPVDMVFVGGLSLLMLFGVLEPESALLGFGSQGLVTVGALYVVVAGVHETGGLRWITRQMLGSPKGSRRALIRLMLPVSMLSAFLNNTPVVALFIPMVSKWARRMKWSPSRFLIPLSYASILGGMCTLIGTSTNLVVNGLYIDRYGTKGLGVFDIAAIGVPCALVGVAYLLLFSRRLLPERESPDGAFDDPRSYTLELVVDEGARLAGKSLEESDLLEVQGAYLAEIVRDNRIVSPVRPAETLQEGDRLLYTGDLSAVRALLQQKGLIPAPNQLFKLDAPRHQHRLVEAVVSHTCPLIGKTLRQGHFRSVYNAVVIAMARNGSRIRGSLADTPLRPGDVLLIESSGGFVPRQRDSGDFYLIHTLEGESEPRARRAPLAFGILTVMVVLAATGSLSMLLASLLGAGLMLATGCCSAATARRRIEWNVLMVIGAALGLGQALEQSGAAGVIADLLLGLAHGDPWQALALVYLTTILFTEVISNNGAVALVFPIAMNTADHLGVSVMPFLMCLMIAGSASFATPIGYQTNLMVYGAGGYRFSDYMRIGIPLNLLIGVLAVLLAPRIWGW